MNNMSAEPEHIIFIEFCITVMLKMAGIISEMVRFHRAGSLKVTTPIAKTISQSQRAS